MKRAVALLLLAGCASTHGEAMPSVACPIPHPFKTKELVAQAQQEKALGITTDSPIGQELLDYWRIRSAIEGK